MRPSTRIGASGLAASLAVLAATAPASAAPKRITGELSKPGYTVIALAANGKARSVRLKGRGFRLRPPARRVTLHLRARNGRYAGPIVVGREKRGRVAILGVRAGTRLGNIRIRRGYATVAKRLAGKRIDRRHRARASNGVPIGARRFGRVRSRRTRGGAPGDRDLDGIPAPLDIDDDGDLILDDVDTNTAGPASAAQAQELVSFAAFTSLHLGATAPTESAIVNANAPGLDDGKIHETLRAHGAVQIRGLPFAPAELDCAGDPAAVPPRPGLTYCSAGGTGKRDQGGNPGFLDPNPQPFPACCDSDGDGLGSLGPGPWPGVGVLLKTGASADEIRAGDLLLVRDPTGAEATRTVTAVFATVPAIKSYVNELGVEHVVSYPLTPRRDRPETVLPVVDGPDAGSDVSVRLTLWRPQRRPVPGETGSWIDIGLLHHFAKVPGVGGYCPQSSYSDVEQELTAFPGFPPGGTGFKDSLKDQAADPGNTFSYTLNLRQCGGAPFPPGGERTINFGAQLPPEAHSTDSAESLYHFRHQP